ncbi:MAG: nuclear transport factor 2 family protein [Acidimicrobiia bacterium]
MVANKPDVIVSTIERWHALLRGELPGGLDDLLAEDAEFYSPIVFTPQRGAVIVKMYLEAAMGILAEGKLINDPAQKFRYTKQVVSGDTAMLEFETEVDQKYVNGIDIIRVNPDGKIVEFRVMIRPLQAVNLLHEKVGALLASLQAPS